MIQVAFYVSVSFIYKISTRGPLTTKFPGSCNRSAQVPGHPEVAYEFPAQSPQNVMSIAESQVGGAHKAHPLPTYRK